MQHQETVRVSGQSSGYVQSVQMGNHQITADEPLDQGGTNMGPNPYDLLLAALGSCTSMTVSMYARTKNWPLHSVSVDLKHFKIETEPGVKSSTVDHIDRDITLVGDLSTEQRARLLEIANKCPVHRTLTSKIDIVSKLI